MDLAQYIAEASLLWRKLFCRYNFGRSKPTPSPSPKRLAFRLGREGEQIAERFLKKRGYKILYRNFKPRHGGEVDLVCRVRGKLELVFVEVKTRSSEDFAAPHEAVDHQKQQGILQAAQEWLDLLDRDDVTARFDIIEVIQEPAHWLVRHLPNAFQAEETLHPGSIPSSPGATPKHVRQANECANEVRFPRRRDRC